MNHRPLCKAPAAWPRLRQTRRLALLFWLYFLEMPIPSHGIAQRLPSRIVAGENLQFAAAIMIEPLDAPLASHCGLLRVVIGAAGCARIVYVDHLVSIGKELFEAVHQIGAEG